MKNLLYIRSGPFKVDISRYNVQVLGLCKQLINKGYNCDIMFIDDYDHDEEILVSETTGCKLRILYRKGIKIFFTGIYPQMLKKKFLRNYDIVVCTEYNQIMTPLVSRLHNNVIMYSGPYYSTFRKKFFSPIYDILFRRTINKKVAKKIVKSEMAKKYMEDKGYRDIQVLGVGLDNSVFEELVEISDETQKVIEVLKANEAILYVGSIDRRKNIEFLLRTYEKIAEKNGNTILVIVGKGDEEYRNDCMEKISEECREKIVWCNHIPNKEMKYIFPNAKVFLFPSVREIFGMVMLEAMYFGCPVITSNHGGSSTVIENEEQGIVLNDFNEQEWAKNALELLEDENLRTRIIENAHRRIAEHFLWDEISEQFLKMIGEK